MLLLLPRYSTENIGRTTTTDLLNIMGAVCCGIFSPEPPVSFLWIIYRSMILRYFLFYFMITDNYHKLLQVLTEAEREERRLIQVSLHGSSKAYPWELFNVVWADTFASRIPTLNLPVFLYMAKVEATAARSKNFNQGGGGEKLKVIDGTNILQLSSDFIFAYHHFTNYFWAPLIFINLSESFKAKAKSLEEFEKKNKELGGPNALKWNV